VQRVAITRELGEELDVAGGHSAGALRLVSDVHARLTLLERLDDRE
jgi:hypothetical protein